MINLWHYLLALVALLGILLPTVTWLLPGHPRHLLPALSVCLAVLVYFLPTPVDAALSLVMLATVIMRYLPIDLIPSEAADYMPAVELAKRTAHAARGRIRKAKPMEITRFVDRAYPDPDKADEGELERADAAAVADDDLDDEDVMETEPSPAETVRERLEKITSDPRLPSKVRGDLASYPGLQRPGLRQQNAPVRKFVPSLI